MKKRYIIAGNMRVGDALGIAHLLTDTDYENWVIGNMYNEQVWEFFSKRTSLHIKGYILMQDKEFLMDMNGYHRYVSRIPKEAYADGEMYLVDADGGNTFKLPLLPSLQLSSPTTPYITVQTDSISDWKAMDVIFRTNFTKTLPGFKIIALCQGKQRIIPGSEVVTDKRLIELDPLIRCARFHIGICSAITRFASMLGVPSIMVHWGPNTKSQGVERVEGLNRDLINPSIKQVEDTLQEFATKTLTREVEAFV